jgi:hypothetical protein
MKITLTCPEDFDVGVYRVVLSLDAGERALVGNNRFVFQIPTLKARLFRVQTQFRFPKSPRTGPYSFHGLFSNGEWHAIVQSNGVKEEQNPTTRTDIKTALEAAVAKALVPFRKDRNPTAR